MSVDARSSAGARSRGGWGVVAAAFVMLTLNTGFGFYSLGAFSHSYIDNTDISLTAASAGATIFLLSNGIGGIPVARLLPRFGLRRVITTSAIISAACLALLGSVQHAWQLWILYFVYGLISAGFSMIPASTMVLERFGDNKLARPLAVSAAGLSVGGAVFAPLINAGVQDWGLTTTGMLMGVALIAALIPVAVVAGSARAKASRDTATGPDPTPIVARPPLVPGAKVTRVFATVCLGFGLLIMSQVAAITHMLTLGMERGISNTALAVSLIAVTSVAGRILGILVLPHVPLKILSLAMSVLQVVSLMIIASAHSVPALILGAVLMGLTVGNNQVFIPLWILGLFGAERYAHLFARANLYASFGVAAAPLYIGLTHQFSGGYFLPFVLVAIGSAIAGLLILTLPNIRQQH